MSDRLPIVARVCSLRSHRRQVRASEHIPPSPLADTACSFATMLVSVLDVQTAIGSVRDKRGPIASCSPNPQTRGVTHIPGAERTPDRARRLGFAWGVEGQVTGSVLQTVLGVLWPPTCPCWLTFHQASGPPQGPRGPSSGPMLRLGDLPGRPRTVLTFRPSPVPAPPVSPAFPTPKAATRCASPPERAVET